MPLIVIPGKYFCEILFENMQFKILIYLLTIQFLTLSSVLITIKMISKIMSLSLNLVQKRYLISTYIFYSILTN